MGTEIRVWQISDDHIKAVEDVALASEHLESELENWIVECPDILGEDLLIISRQKKVQGVGRWDLLAIQADGQLVIVELKRAMTPREAVTQALDYTSWLDKVSEPELLEIAEDYLKGPVDEAFKERFGKEMPAVNSHNHRILLVGSGLDAAAERIINYLAQRHSVNLNAVFFRYAKLPTGQQILARSVLVAESVLQPAIPRRDPTVSELLATATARQVLPMVEMFRGLGKDEKYASEQAANTFQGSFRYWRENTEGKGWKMVLGVNVSGKRLKDSPTPIGQLDIWIPIATLAQVVGVSDTQARDMVNKLPVLEIRGADAIVRLKDERSAREVAKRIEGWFEKFSPAMD